MKILVVHDVVDKIDCNEQEQEVVFTEKDVAAVLKAQGHTVAVAPIGDDVWEPLQSFDPREWLIFNLCEQIRAKTYLEPYATFIYEHLGFGYTGSNGRTLATCLNKARAKEILQAHGVSTAQFQVCTPTSIRRRLSFPLFVKPVSEDASIGITNQSVVHDDASLRRQVARIWERYRQPALVEEFIEGREFNVTILGGDAPRVLPLSEIEFKRIPDPFARIVSFRAKWVSASPEFKFTVPRCPARVSAAVHARIEQVALQAYQTLGLRDYGRVDLRVRNGAPYVLEVNPNADLSNNAGIARAARMAGLSYADLIDEIVRFAARRFALKGAGRPRIVTYALRARQIAGAPAYSIPPGALAPAPPRVEKPVSPRPAILPA